MKESSIKQSAARVLIVDDHPAVREALSIRIGGVPDLEVCGEADDTADALRLVEETKPDLAVVDISLKTGNGLDLIKRIKQRDLNIRVLVWSMFNEQTYAERALRAGAMGYITKEQATDRIIEALRRIRSGMIYLSDSAIDRVLRGTVGVGTGQGRLNSVEALSDRELEVMRQIGKGQKTASIAARMHLSIKTVETYRDRIRSKLALESGAELARFAAQWVLENG
jgi:DNA-binding NarL/FixJ family response regulator